MIGENVVAGSLTDAELLCLLRAVEFLSTGMAAALCMEELLAVRAIGQALRIDADREITRRNTRVGT